VHSSLPRRSSGTPATSPGSRARTTSPATTAPHLSRRRPDRRCVTGSTRAATGSSTLHCMSPRHRKRPTAPSS